MVVKRSTNIETKALIFDIEGTTTSISFVKDTLFPFVRENLAEFVQRQWNDAEFQGVLSLLKEQCTRDASSGIAEFVPIPDDGNEAECQKAVVNNVLWQMNLDAKNKALKQLQGHIMREGYKKGQLKGHIYADVVPALKNWNQNGLKLYVYSSGSIEAQKLLFGHSMEGDLLELFSGHFDTDVGSKTEPSSYTKIAKQLECQSEEIVFFTDMPTEAYAAREAGLSAVLVVRDGNADLGVEDKVQFLVIQSLKDFEWEVPTKRRKISADEMPAKNLPNADEPAEKEDEAGIEVKKVPVSNVILADTYETDTFVKTNIILNEKSTETEIEDLTEMKENVVDPITTEHLESNGTHHENSKFENVDGTNDEKEVKCGGEKAKAELVHIKLDTAEIVLSKEDSIGGSMIEVSHVKQSGLEDAEEALAEENTSLVNVENNNGLKEATDIEFVVHKDVNKDNESHSVLKSEERDFIKIGSTCCVTDLDESKCKEDKSMDTTIKLASDCEENKNPGEGTGTDRNVEEELVMEVGQGDTLNKQGD